ncbi:hypothetical protein ACFL2V_12355 [Pseudomonadota bacterium]
MKTKLLSLSLLFSAAFATLPLAQAAETSWATEQMAKIVLHMENAPNADDRVALEDISMDSASTIHEKALADTLLKVDKKIRPADKKSIMRIWISPNASETERSIAKALLKFDSTLDNKNREILSQLVTTE